MNKSGQIGAILLVFVAVVVGLALFAASAANVHTYSNTIEMVNETATLGTAGEYTDLTGQEYINGVVVTNYTTGKTVLAAGNYSIGEGVSSTTGVKSVRLLADAAIANGQYADVAVNVSYVYGPDGYIDDAGGRSMAGIIIVFFALAIAIIVLVPILKSRFD